LIKTGQNLITQNVQPDDKAAAVDVRYDRLKWLTSNETSRYIARGRGIDRRQALSSL